MRCFKYPLDLYYLTAGLHPSLSKVWPLLFYMKKRSFIKSSIDQLIMYCVYFACNWTTGQFHGRMVFQEVHHSPDVQRLSSHTCSAKSRDHSNRCIISFCTKNTLQGKLVQSDRHGKRKGKEGM